MKLGLYFIALLGYLFAALDVFGFGIHGYNGDSGEDGSHGVDGQKIVIFASDEAIHKSPGEDGRHGEDGMAGYDASQCRQPFKSRTNIRGANGGHGGDGGDGGDGGQGGDAVIFYERLSELLNVTLVNNGGRGGKAGEGGHYGGYPCFCSEKSWRFIDCKWQLFKRSKAEDEDQSWQRTWHTKTTDCTDFTRRPRRWPQDESYRYKWRLSYESVNNYYCADGVYGYPGKNGVDGKMGDFGKVTLVKGSSIPKESPIYKARISESLSKFYDLSKNVFVQKLGLKSLLSNDSLTSDKYEIYERTDKKKFGIAWRLPHGPAYYGLQNKEVTVILKQMKDGSTQFILELPGEPIYTVKKLDTQIWNIEVTGFKGKLPNPREKIEICQDKNGKGAFLCELSSKCVYESGICSQR